MYVLTADNYHDKLVDLTEEEHKFVTDTFDNMSRVQELLFRKVLEKNEKEG
jgi:hypothetical protein